ncbi:GntR family transcriptional regulator [Nocardia flavorosea]|uniref:GntR family transcriptional regulator n=1 Tax=Nocardia flavorosea TaxID=53429 RepID=A0A846Y5B6_9NOCA|nr:GntR family transcriptional regulator [Nocardia flavorosea]NKY54716.1 GntR family transcriptional regulator [Nocardia flavorosea]
MSELSDRIFELVVAGHYGPGEKLNETELAERMGVSRTPIREALKELANTGVVVVERNKGARVREQTEESVEATFDLRSLVEPRAAGLAATAMSSETIDLLRASALRMRDEVSAAGSLTEIAALNHDFHTTILASCPNRRLADVALGLLKPIVASRTLRSYGPEELRRSANHHLEIVDAVAYRDAEWVEAVMRAHIRAGFHTAVKSVVPTPPRTAVR